MTWLVLAGICAVALGAGLLGWLAWQPGAFDGLSRWRLWHRRLLAARRQGHAASVPSVRAMRAALPAQAVQAHHPPAAPRLLFIGDAAANLPALLATVAPEGPVQDARPSEAPFWRWWQLPRLTAIEVCPPPPPEEPPQDLLWLHALRTLVQTQPGRPLDGIVCCLSTALLRADPKVAQPLVQLLARRIRETARLLDQRLPVHLLLTGLQDLPGYAAVHAALPAPLRAQVLGWCAPPVPPDQPWQEAMTTWQTSLHGLRLSLMAQPHTARERHDIHRFVEALLALEPGLNRLHQMLEREEEPPETTLQGFYLMATGPQPAFVQDLFARFLPMEGGSAPGDG